MILHLYYVSIHFKFLNAGFSILKNNIIIWMSLFDKFCHTADCSCKQSQHGPLKVVLEIYDFWGRSQVLQNWPQLFPTTLHLHFKSMMLTDWLNEEGLECGHTLCLQGYAYPTDLYCESRLDKTLWAELAVLWFNSWKTEKNVLELSLI